MTVHPYIPLRFFFEEFYFIFYDQLVRGDFVQFCIQKDFRNTTYRALQTLAGFNNLALQDREHLKDPVGLAGPVQPAALSERDHLSFHVALAALAALRD